MSPEQKELARHALGLPNAQRRSYRNRFMAGEGHDDYANWQAMVAAGYAYKREKPLAYGGDDLFWLRKVGAELALLPGETLDTEDFPA